MKKCFIIIIIEVVAIVLFSLLCSKIVLFVELISNEYQILHEGSIFKVDSDRSVTNIGINSITTYDGTNYEEFFLNEESLMGGGEINFEINGINAKALSEPRVVIFYSINNRIIIYSELIIIVLTAVIGLIISKKTKVKD